LHGCEALFWGLRRDLLAISTKFFLFVLSKLLYLDLICGHFDFVDLPNVEQSPGDTENAYSYDDPVGS